MNSLNNKAQSIQFADELFNSLSDSYENDKHAYNQPNHQAINLQQTFTNKGANWYHLKTDLEDPEAVLLIHGLMSSPLELRSLAEKFNKNGFHAVGVRLNGHGTSPWNLRDTTWNDWNESIQNGYNVLSAYSNKIHIIGFSTGGLLAVNFAASKPDNSLASVTSISAPVLLRDKKMKLVPLIHSINRLFCWLFGTELITFRPNNAEHPEVNYAHAPVRSLNQLLRLTHHFLRQDAVIPCPVRIFQSNHDPVVMTKSAQLLYDHILSDDKQIEFISSTRHGIVYEDIDNTQQKIIKTISSISD